MNLWTSFSVDCDANGRLNPTEMVRVIGMEGAMSRVSSLHTRQIDAGDMYPNYQITPAAMVKLTSFPTKIHTVVL